MRRLLFIFAALLCSARGQETSNAASLATSSLSATSTTSQAFTTTVAVGLAGNTFAPDVVQVPVGGFVEFDFYPTNHSVIRAEYKYPCVPYELTGIGKVGFYSGFQPVDVVLTNPPKWTLQINDSNPIFYYCGAPNSCIGYSMVGVINPNASVSIDVQRAYAANSSFMLEPGQNWPGESNPLATTSTAVTTQTATATSTSTSAPTPTSQVTPTSEATHSHATLSSGGIAGVAIGGAALLLIAAVLLFCCGRKFRKTSDSRPNDPATPAMGSVTAPPGYAPVNTNYGYNSPASKHMSVVGQPMTDAFGAPIQSNGMYGFTPNYPQGYAGSPLHQPPSMSLGLSQPPNDRLGALTPSLLPPVGDSQPNTETNSRRGAASPDSAYAAAAAAHPPPPTGGIEGFLQRQDRTSFQTEPHPSGPPVHAQYQVGPYEM